MDQWTARSVNKLKKKTIVEMKKQNGQEYVHEIKNTSANYKEFLSVVSEVKEELNLSSVLKAEELIFSSSHKKNLFKKILSNRDHQILSAWRKYIAEDVKLNFNTLV